MSPITRLRGLQWAGLKAEQHSCRASYRLDIVWKICIHLQAGLRRSFVQSSAATSRSLAAETLVEKVISPREAFGGRDSTAANKALFTSSKNSSLQLRSTSAINFCWASGIVLGTSCALASSAFPFCKAKVRTLNVNCKTIRDGGLLVLSLPLPIYRHLCKKCRGYIDYQPLEPCSDSLTLHALDDFCTGAGVQLKQGSATLSMGLRWYDLHFGLLAAAIGLIEV